MRASCSYLDLLLNAPEDLRAYLFLFSDVANVGRSAAACRQLRACLWDEACFWRAFALPCVEQVPPGGSAATLRRVFRKWLFHLDGDWAWKFRGLVEEARLAQFGPDFLRLLSDAGYLVSGLMPEDRGPAVGDFAQTVCQLLAEYNPTMQDERKAASTLVNRICQRRDVFAVALIENAEEAYDLSVERCVADQLDMGDDDHDPFADVFERESQDDVQHGMEDGEGAVFLGGWQPPDGLATTA